VAGTDGMAGFDLHRELELYVKAGIPADKVLQIATINTARYVKKDRDLGSITIGKMADILLVEGDPVLNISNIRKTRFVISGSSVFDAGRLYEAITIKPR
jgi:imidazolonepropionase-like amidohydrolase